MFDFEKLEVYRKARNFNKVLRRTVLKNSQIDRSTKSQLNRAALSIMLNIAEGSGRFTNPDKGNFYTIARGSVFECVALVHFLLDEKIVNPIHYSTYYELAEELPKCSTL